MATIVEQLNVLQERDGRIRRLARERADVPEHKKQIDSQLDRQRGLVAEAQEALKKQTSAAHNLDVEANARRERIKKLRDQQLQIKSNVEYKALEKEIGALEGEIRGLEDNELEIMERMEAARAALADAEKELKAQEQRVLEEAGLLEKRLKAIDGELAELQAERDRLAADVDPVWLQRYQRIMEKRGDHAMVPVTHDACGGCHMKLPPSVVHDSRRPDTMTVCNFCGRLLFWP